MTRLERKGNFQEQDGMDAGRGVFGLMDGVMMKVFRINDDELDAMKSGIQKALKYFEYKNVDKIFLLFKDKISGRLQRCQNISVRIANSRFMTRRLYCAFTAGKALAGQ